MAKKTKQDAIPFDIVNGNFDEHDGYDIEVSLQNKLRTQDAATQSMQTAMQGKADNATIQQALNALASDVASKVSDVSVNGTPVQKEQDGSVDIPMPTVTVDESLDETSDNPISNAAVTTALRQMESLLAEKYGYAIYQNGSIIFYDEENGNVIQTLTLSGDIYNIFMGYTGSSVFSVLTGDDEKILTIAPTTTVQTQVGGEQTPVEESYDYVVAVNTGSGYVNRIGANNVTGTIPFDIRPHLIVGTNMVRITVTGNTSQVTKSLTLTVTLTSLSLTCNHNWRTPWNENEEYTITSIFFAGAIQKTLHIAVDSSEITELSHIYSPSENASTISKNITIPSEYFPIEDGGNSGQHTVEIWMTGTGVETKHIVYNILCVLEGETLPLVCINNVASKAVNFASNTLFEFYAINTNRVDVDIVVVAGGISHSLSRQSIMNPEDYALNTFTTQMEVESEATDGTVTATVYASNDGEDIDTEVLAFAFDNSLAFLATSGAVFYFNAGTRSNSEATKQNIINTIDDTNYVGTWQGMTWYTDGWLTDNNGHKALALPAGTSVTFDDLTPMTFADNRDGLTIEMMLMASVVADFDTPVLQFIDTKTGTDGQDVTVGLIIYPTKIQVVSNREREELSQEVGLSENTITHLCITWQKNYAGTGKNLCSIYVNGIPNVTFEYNVNSEFGEGSLQLGQNSTDTYLYMMRIYNRALEGTEILANMLNAVINGVEFNREQVRENNNIMTDSIQYALTRDKYNCFVIEPDDETNDIPSYFNQATVYCTVYFEYAQHHDWDVKITNVPVDGQGTTSKKYFRWNLRGKLADNSEWYYTDGNGTTRGMYEEEATFTGKKGYMDGGADGGDHLKIERWTAKKNVASSPQGHKMGATALYDELFTQIGLKEELPDEDYRVAVWQYPFVGFKKTGDSYEYIGLYTIGPDKGCKVTFGYDKSLYPKAMCIEGPNHAPRGTRFLHPWVDVTYSSTDETLKFGGQEGWDDDFSSVGSSDDVSKESKILQCYESEWKPAYDIAYHCSPYIAKLTEATMDGTQMGLTDADALAAINASISMFLATGQTTNGEKNELMSFYDANYDIYFYRNQTGRFEKLNDANFNILTYLEDYLNGNTTPTTSEIISARVAKFRAEMGNYFSLQQTLYHKCFCMLVGAKDNDAKNSYPFKHLALSEGGRWGWKQDDLDSIFDTDNNGQATVKYSAEHGDLKNNAEIYQGCDSAFWTLIWRYYQQELGTMMARMMSGIRSIALAKNLVSGSGIHLHDYVFATLKYYFFDNSAKYFPELAYYYDRKFSYLDPWQVVGQPAPDGKAYPATYNNVYPLKQALGDRYQDESLWVWRRIAYIFSKYSIGAFSGNGDGWGQIAFALLSQYTFNLTPAIDLYPAGSVGGDAVKGNRTNAGETDSMTIAASAGTTNYINAADWLESIGDLKDMMLVNRTGGTDRNFNVVSERMETLKVGDAVAENVLFNATALEVSGPAFKVVDARNVVTIAGVVDLRNCPRLQQALFSGNTASGLLLPVGSRVDEVSFPENTQELCLHSLNKLTYANLSISFSALGNIRSYYFYKCEQINTLKVLSDILGVNGNRLMFVSMTWDGNIAATATEWSSLVALANGTYYNVNYDSANGLVNDIDNLPNINGTVSVGFAYKEDEDALNEMFPNLITNVQTYYIKFQDPEVERICSTLWGNYHEVITVDNGDGTVTVTTNFVQMTNTTVSSRTQESVITRTKLETDVAGTKKVMDGMTYAQAAAVTTLGQNFRSKSLITSFDELNYFTNVRSLGEYAFSGCSALRSVGLANITSAGRAAFGASGLYYAWLPVISTITFSNSAGNGQFYNTRSLNAIRVDSITSIDGIFYNSTIQYIVITTASVPTRQSSTAFPSKVYVLDHLVPLYQVTTNWTNRTILPLSQLPKDYPNCPWIEDLIEQGFLQDYIDFEDTEVKRVCCLNWGDYTEAVATETVTDDSDTVSISTTYTYVSKVNSATTRTALKTITSSRAKTESDVAGTTSTTTNYPVGITEEQAAVVKTMGTAFNGQNGFYNSEDLYYINCMVNGVDGLLINHNTANRYGVNNSSYFSTKYIKVSPYDSLTFILKGGEVMLYRKDFVYTDYWSGDNRTVALSANCYWARVSFPTNQAGNVYVKNNTTGEYLYKGANVS